VHSEGVERLHQTSREGLEIPKVDDVTATLPDDVEHNHSSLRELVQSPKGSHENVSHSSLVEHDDMHEVFVDLLQVQADRLVEHDDVQSNSHRSPHVGCTIDLSLVSHEATEGSLDGTGNVEQEVLIQNALAQNVMPEVHSNFRIEQDMDLWQRVKEYDKKIC